MNGRNFIPLTVVAVIAALIGCGKPAGTIETKSQTTTTNPQGKVQVNEEVRKVGSTVETRTETKSKTEEGTVKTDVETYVGTVTVYDPGRKIEVLTGENTRHSFDLDAKALMVEVVGPVTVGSRVRLVARKGDQGAWASVTVDSRP